MGVLTSTCIVQVILTVHLVYNQVRLAYTQSVEYKLLGLDLGYALNFGPLDLSGPQKSGSMSQGICLGPRVRPNKRIGPNIANWALGGPLMGL